MFVSTRTVIRQSHVAKTFGFVFLAVGVLGFLPNPIVSGDGLFEVNALHNVVHLLSGVVALGAGYASETASENYNVGFGAVYALVTLLGFVGVGFVVDLVALNPADNVLHLAITVALLGAGLTLETGSARTA
jgi:preprotein translocase subunit Sss1